MFLFTIYNDSHLSICVWWILQALNMFCERAHFCCRANYSQALDLLEQEFLLKGRKYLRKDLQVNAIFNSLVNFIVTYESLLVMKTHRILYFEFRNVSRLF